MTVKERAARRLRNTRCKGCGDFFQRGLPNCPTCKLRKGAPASRPAQFGSWKYE